MLGRNPSWWRWSDFESLTFGTSLRNIDNNTVWRGEEASSLKTWGIDHLSSGGKMVQSYRADGPSFPDLSSVCSRERMLPSREVEGKWGRSSLVWRKTWITSLLYIYIFHKESNGEMDLRSSWEEGIPQVSGSEVGRIRHFPRYRRRWNLVTQPRTDVTCYF